MASLTFTTIGVVGKPHNEDAAENMLALREFLSAGDYRVLFDEALQQQLEIGAEECASWQQLGEKCDLIVVVGGDGSMLFTGRRFAQYDIPLVGINRGYLGFLTDIEPTKFREKLTEVLNGNYSEERRFLLEATISHRKSDDQSSSALNDIVLYPGEISRMIEFEVYIDNLFVYSQRADGLIVATPTGSTAYSLSAGGPIMAPTLDAMVLVPMFPHTLSNRPIAINADSEVDIVLAKSNDYPAQLSCDGQVRMPVEPGDTIKVRKKSEDLWLLHPGDYDYFKLLRTKLGWGSKL